MSKQPASASWEQGPSLAEQAVQRRLGDKQLAVADEVRRLLDVGLELMRTSPDAGPPRVADIVRVAGVSNDAFYRAFGSRDDFMAAIVDDGTRRLLSYLAHQRDRSTDPTKQIRYLVEGLLRQAGDPVVATTTRAVLNSTRARRGGLGASTVQLHRQLGELFEPCVQALGGSTPIEDAATLTAAAFASMERALWSDRPAHQNDVDYLTELATRLARD